jgi:LPS-assembly protein
VAPAPLAAAALCLVACGVAAQPLPPYRRTAPAPPPPPPAATANPQVTLTADDVVSRIGGVAQARGSVELKRLDVDLYTDYLEYDQLTDTAHAQGNVRVRRGLDWFDADRVDIEVQQTAGTMTNATYGLGRTHAGGKASRIELVDRDHATAFDADYTSCPRDTTDEPDWVLSGRRIDIDQAKNEGRAEGGRLHFLGVPILAAPSLSFPVTSERKSGWLPPTSDFSNASGFTFGVPYYWDLAPNVDTTLTPTIITKRGSLLAAEVRYLGSSDLGQFTAVGLPNDQVFGDARGSFQWAHEGTSGELTSYSARWQQVSDPEYWKDFPHQVSALTQRLLPVDLAGVRRFPFGNGEFDTYARVQRWQTLQESKQDLPDANDYASALIVPPYQRSPQVGVRGSTLLGNKLRFDLEAEANRFDLNDQVQGDPRGDGNRLHLTAALSREWASSWGRIEPRLSINGADYHTDDPMKANENRRSASRWIPTFSTDSSVSLDRNTTLFGREMVQSLEPRLLYVFTPYHDQSKLPLYDTAPKDFNEVSIYSDNAFTGIDRISDLNALTAGVTTRFNDALNGRELLRLGIAQRFLFKNELVTPDNQPDTRKISDLLLWGSTSMVRNWNFDGTLEFNPSSDWTQRAILSTRYSPGPYRTLSATYRYARGTGTDQFTRATSEQYEVSGQWPIYHRSRSAAQGGGCGGTLYAVGRVNYSVTDQRVNYAVGGFEYDAGCWVGRLVVERTSTSRDEATTHVVLQLELIGLSTLGSGSLRILKDNIPGYQPLHDESASAQVPRSP